MNTLLETLLYEWRERKLPSAIRRDTPLQLRSVEGINHAFVITGFRRVGKTYLLYDAISRLLETRSRHDVVYLNFEDERLVPATTDLLTDLIPHIQALYGQKPKYLFLDEVQLVPNWSKWVRRMVDTESITLVVTGSSSKMSSAELPTELRGRAWEITVRPLTFNEFLRFKQQEVDLTRVDAMKTEAARFRFLFDEYLTFGALPAVVLTPMEKKQELLQSYFHTVVQKDISERHRIKNDVALRTLLKLLLNAGTITISKLHRNLQSLGIKIGKSTIDTYLSSIEESYFIEQVSIHHPKVINQLHYPRKVYVVDTGFLTALSTKFSKNTGRLFEHVTFHQLARMHDTLHYYRDARGHEVDFAVLEDGKTTALYQVCVDLTDEDTQRREILSLLSAGRTLHCSNLYVVTLDVPDSFRPPHNIQVISAAAFLQGETRAVSATIPA